MNFKYKDNRSPNFFACSRLYKAHDDSCDLPEEMILQAQTAFLKIMNLNPESLTDDLRPIFAELEDIANFEKIKNHLPKIIPRLIFPQLVAFLALTKDPYIHRVVSHIIVILSSDVTKSLIELEKSDILGAVDVSMSVFKFPYSTDYLFQIIANFIDDPDPNVSQYAHNLYTIEYLFKIFQYIKGLLEERLDKDKDPDIKIDPNEMSDLIRNKWMMCIYTTISKYTEEVSVNHAIITLIEVRKYFDIIQKDPLLCKYLCCSISALAYSNKIDYSDFNGYKFPEFLYNLSCCESDDSVKLNAFLAIGQLIELNRFELQIDFYHFFDVVLNSNESTDQNLIISSLYASRCFLINSISCEYTFEQITDKIQLLFNFYDITVFQIKDELNRLFSDYVVCFSKYNDNNLLQYESIIFTITNYFFDFIQIADDVESIAPIMNALLELNNYLYITGQNSLPSATQFINDLNENIESLKNSEYNDIREFTNVLLKAGELNNI